MIKVPAYAVVLMLLVSVPAPCQVVNRAMLHPPAPSAPAPRSFVAANTGARPVVTLSSATASVAQGEGATLVVTVTSEAAFSGSVTLSASVVPADNAPTAAVNPSSLTLAAGESQTATLVVSTQGSTPAANYTVNVQATGSGLNAETATAVITVQAAGTDLFSQGTLQFSSEESAKPAVAIQAIDVYFGKNQTGQLSVRATLPTSSASPPTGESVYSGPNQNLKTQALDAFGGIVNVSGAWQTPPGTPVSIDLRGALKIVEVPRASAEAKLDAYTQSPFLTFGANLRWAAVGVDRSGNKAFVTLVGSYFLSAVPDSSVPLRFSTPLKRVSHNANGSFTFVAPGAHLYFVAQYRWSNDAQLGHEFVFSVNPAR